MSHTLALAIALTVAVSAWIAVVAHWLLKRHRGGAA